jgi:hypothetical protein
LENFGKKVETVVDVGMSTTKIVFRREGDVIQYLLQPSGLLQFHPDLYEDNLHLIDRDTAVVKLSDGTAWVIGEGAGREPAEAGSKSLTAIAKIVAAVGQICDSSTRLSLAVMLPTNEKSSFVDFGAELTEELYSAKVNGKRWAMTLNEPVKVFAEGTGLTSLIEDGILLMFGQKDVSLLQVQRGKIVAAQCFVGWGMVKLLSQLPESVTDEVTAAHAVFRFLLKGNEKPLHDLFNVKADKVIAKLPVTFQSYWIELSRRISRFSGIAEADHIYVGGGNAPIMAPLVSKSFRQKCDAKSLVAQVNEHFSDLEKKPLAYRMSDPLALFLRVWG